MKIDKLTKLLLILTIALLAVLLIRPILIPIDAYSKKVTEYKTLRYGGEKALNESASEGWRLHSVVTIKTSGKGGQFRTHYIAILER